jgi:hypothetical protein
MLNEPSGTYEDEKAFRKAVEKEAKASTSDPDWSDLSKGRYEPFDAVDFTEMVNTLREFSAQKSKSSPESKTRGYRRAHVQRAADEAREMVESFRLDLFGHTHPPFPNRGVEAADWIESIVQEPQTQRLVIEVTTPANLNLMESIIWCADYLSRQTESYNSITDYDSAAAAPFIETGENIRSIGFRIPLLEYLGVNDEGGINIKRVQAPDGTSLGRLQGYGEQLATALDWKPYAAVHHLLTGGVSSPPGVETTIRYRTGRHSFGDDHKVTLVVSDPGSVTNNDLVNAYRKEKSRIVARGGGNQPKRARVSSKSERVAAFVEQTPGMPWKKRLDKWNRQYPDERFRTESAIKAAQSRASASRP